MPASITSRSVSVVGEVKGEGERVTLTADEVSIELIARENAREGKRVEVRGQVLDIGRIVAGRSAADSLQPARPHPHGLSRSVAASRRRSAPDGLECWRTPGLVQTSTRRRCAPWRWIPTRFAGQRVTLVGQFRGRNLFGDLPEAPISSKWEYVIRSADAAVWVMGLEPKGKTFNFDVNKRIDSGRWVKVAGTVRTAKGLTWLEGTSIELTQAPAEAVTEVAVPPAASHSGGSAVQRADARAKPTCGSTSASACSSRATSIPRRSRITSASPIAAQAKDGRSEPPVVAFTATYTRENRALEIRPNQPWERFRVGDGGVSRRASKARTAGR